MSFALARENMVESQLRPNRVTDKLLLQRFLNVPREIFVDVASRSIAYMDDPVLMGAGRKMMTPLVTARMLQELQLTETDTLLVVAAGTGYSSCLASPLVSKVVAVEENVQLVDVARRNVIELGLGHVTVVDGKPQEGAAKFAPFDKILFDAAVGEVPSALIRQLKEGGRLAAVVALENGIMEASVFTKVGHTLFETTLFETKGDVLGNFARTERFVF
jgi:protein-L-isoaspartate(D-aspartate) O-methyltransferase